MLRKDVTTEVLKQTCGLNYLKDLVGDCVCWGWGWWEVWIGVGTMDTCRSVHAITEAF